MYYSWNWQINVLVEQSLLSALPSAEFEAFWSGYKVLLSQGNWGDKRWFGFEWPLFDLQSGSCCGVLFHTEDVIWDCAILMANMTNIQHELRQVEYLAVEVNLVFVKGNKLLAVGSPVCCREGVLGRNSTSFADLLHLWPGGIQASSHWLILI